MKQGYSGSTQKIKPPTKLLDSCIELQPCRKWSTNVSRKTLLN